MSATGANEGFKRLGQVQEEVNIHTAYLLYIIYIYIVLLSCGEYVGKWFLKR
jgi:hypothetical protein